MGMDWGDYVRPKKGERPLPFPQNEVLIKSLLIKHIQDIKLNRNKTGKIPAIYEQYATGINSAQDKGIVKKMLIMVMFTTYERMAPAGDLLVLGWNVEV